MRELRVGATVAFVACCFAGSVEAAVWVEVNSPNFTILSDAGEKEARRTAWQFEQIRQALKVVLPWARVDGTSSFVVYAARDEKTLKSLGPQYWEGKRFRPLSFWVRSVDRDYVALRTDVSEPSEVGANPYQDAYFPYISTVLGRSLPRDAPYWFVRGFARVLSNTIVRSKELHIGRLMEDELQRVRDGALIPQAEFFAVKPGSKWTTQDSDSWLFEAQAWAFMHSLLFADKSASAPRVELFTRMLLEGSSVEVATKEAFGPEMTPYFQRLRTYIAGSLFPYRRVLVDATVKAEGFTVRALSASEAAAARGALLVAMNRPVESRAAAAEARAADAAAPGADEIEGLLLDREGKRDEARAAYAKAAERGSRRGYIYYRLAELEVGYAATDAEKRARGISLLEKANTHDPGLANAFSFHAQLSARHGDQPKALELLGRAIALEPNTSYHRMVAADVLWNAGSKNEAIQAAQTALKLADDDRERANAQRFLEFASKSNPPRPPG